MSALLAVVVFVASTLIDFAHTRYVVAVTRGAAVRAATWSVIQWSAATVGFVIAVKVSLWYLPFEVAGLFVGTLLAVRRC